MERVHRQRLDWFHERFRNQGFLVTVTSHYDRQSDAWRCKLRVFVNGSCVTTEVLGAFEAERAATRLRDEARDYLNDLATPGSADRAAKSGGVGPSDHAPAVEVS